MNVKTQEPPATLRVNKMWKKTKETTTNDMDNHPMPRNWPSLQAEQVKNLLTPQPTNADSWLECSDLGPLLIWLLAKIGYMIIKPSAYQ